MRAPISAIFWLTRSLGIPLGEFWAESSIVHSSPMNTLGEGWREEQGEEEILREIWGLWRWPDLAYLPLRNPVRLICIFLGSGSWGRGQAAGPWPLLATGYSTTGSSWLAGLLAVPTGSTTIDMAGWLAGCRAAPGGRGSGWSR